MLSYKQASKSWKYDTVQHLAEMYHLLRIRAPSLDYGKRESLVVSSDS